MPSRHALALLLIALAGLAAPAAAAPLSFDGALDIGALLTEARQAWDFTRQDAVLLLEQARFTWSGDGRLREERHRIVWIGSDLAQDTFADLRVPWDSDRQTLTVAALRVWREDRSGSWRA